MNTKKLKLSGKNNLPDKPNEDDSLKNYFEIFKCSRGDKFTHRPNNIALAFLTKGEIEMSINDCPTKTVRKNEFFIIPNTVFNFYAVKDSNLLCLYLNEQFIISDNLCHCIRNKILTSSPQTGDNEPLILEMESLLKVTVYNFLKLIENGSISCKSYITYILMQIIALIFLLFPDKFEQFFAPANRQNSPRTSLLDNDFTARIIQYSNRLFTVKELANALNMTTTTLRRNIKRIFGLTPQKWILEQRKKLIYRELTESNKTMLEIAELAGFSSGIQIYIFAKKHFNCTVKDIRLNKI
ncbi:MAG: AraC family transcriptional regulator [Dysgonamonadaceae bacterium]|jgi:AraC-like DNA-binding protein|nr:AraC family transcriptional regulator [Dysgonamonadaceae bacterium]